jgi:transcriptional regulator with XRE-family HTH domain
MSATAQKAAIKSMASFGQRLAQIRKAKGLTQVELGKMIGVSQRIIHHYENKAEYPPTQKIIELAQALNMSIDGLLDSANHASEENFQDIKPNLAKKLRQASNLPTHDLKALTTFIDALILKQQVKGEQKEKINEA